MEHLLEIQSVHTNTGEIKILNGLSLTINPGEIHAIMGPNGSGKSTLANTIAGNPSYQITDGDILFKGQSITAMSPDQRARLGLFLAFQYPVAVPGVTVVNFLRQAVNAVRGKDLPIREFREELFNHMDSLSMDREFARRYLNDGFSGGEKKRTEMLQLAMLKPSLAVLVADGVNSIMNPDMGLLLITHYQRLLDYIKPQFVHVLIDGKIVKTGGPELAEELEKSGYDALEPAKISGE